MSEIRCEEPMTETKWGRMASELLGRLTRINDDVDEAQALLLRSPLSKDGIDYVRIRALLVRAIENIDCIGPLKAEMVRTQDELDQQDAELILRRVQASLRFEDKHPVDCDCDACVGIRVALEGGCRERREAMDAARGIEPPPAEQPGPTGDGGKR